ncbi:zinc finger protein 157-like isoform X1 [Eublepharis macularius]|uniref:Zinc finger protein 157-like isoform X1 n=1 Tax=Eublepharis macularius TaxID=481883 RepID=A0AA97J5Y0_EUBMA|nr:zinc finger protein 157-like isoform X1 [Eublepharis macularius]XP_054831561.1 zinc finger protein 157-like isoform X1 [Eublepharis macularius]
MKEQPSALPGEEPEGARNPTSMAQSEFVGEQSSWKATQDTRWDLSKGMQQHWEAQWQEFLKTLQFPHSAWGSPQLAETTLWDDAKAFLTSFEQVAQACQWPREEWVTRLLPALSGEAQQAFGSLEARDREDYGKVKAAILRGEANRMEMLRQHFRQFRSREVDDPRRIYSQLQDLCCQWLRPERHSKEQILELLILEQFLAILPPELQGWIRAGGPENCTQAAALVDDFLLSQQKVETWKWQEPLQEMIRGSLEAEGGPPLDFGQRRLAKETKQNSNGDASLLGSGMKCPSDPESSVPPKEQEATKAGMTEAPVTTKESGMSLHVVEPAQAKPGQRTMFWQVMQEEEGNADSLEGLLVPKSDLASHLEKDDEMFVQFPEESERLPGRDPGIEKRSRIKMEGSRQGETGPEETQGTVAEISQWNFSVAPEIHVQRCDEKRSQIKVENSQQGDIGPEEIYGTLAEITQWNVLGTFEIHNERYESNWQQEKPGENEGSQFMEGLTDLFSNTYPVDTERKKPFFSNSGRKNHYKSGFMRHTRENPNDNSLTLGQNIQPKHCFDQHQRIHTGDKQYEFGKRDNLLGHQSNHIGEKPYGCLQCGKNFSCIKSLKRHQGVHTEGGAYLCAQCGKCFRYKETLKKHQIIHTGEKLHGCPECGKSFTLRGALTRHRRIHTGEKPFECSQCGKCFRQREHLMVHRRTHTGEKPYICPECGRNFSRSDKLTGHLRTHRGQRPYGCPDCGKRFSHKTTLTKHQSIHVPH